MPNPVLLSKYNWHTGMLIIKDCLCLIFYRFSTCFFKPYSDLRSPRSAVLHWDFHPEKIILRPDGLMVAIDWNGVQVSDQRFELAWTLILIMAYESSQLRQLILASYERLNGVPMGQLDFFDVATCLRQLYSIAASIAAGVKKKAMRL